MVLLSLLSRCFDGTELPVTMLEGWNISVKKRKSNKCLGRGNCRGSSSVSRIQTWPAEGLVVSWGWYRNVGVYLPNRLTWLAVTRGKKIGRDNYDDTLGRESVGPVLA